MEEIGYVATPETEPTAIVPSLGLLLRKAREARGLSIEDVVHTLKFSARQIEAVEADRMDIMPSSVFLRGLIRSYARFLKLDPEPLLGLLGTGATSLEPDIRAPENMGNAAPRGGLHQIPPLIALSILLLIAAGVMTGWQFFGTGMPQLQKVDGGSPRAIIEELKPVPATSPAVPAHVAAAAVPSVPAVSSEVASPARTTQPVVLPTDMRRLSFDFHGESWIEVKDASGLVILTGLYTGGNHSVAGRPPFEVVIGNAAAVTLLDDGHPVDLKPNTRAEVARFTLE